MAEQKIFGYADKISVRPGDEISFFVHADGTKTVDAQLGRKMSERLLFALQNSVTSNLNTAGALRLLFKYPPSANVSLPIGLGPNHLVLD